MTGLKVRFALLLFIAALLPRLYKLGIFLTIDELKWAEGATQFLLALRTGDLSQTYWHFFPGITISWGSSLILGTICLPEPDMAVCIQKQVEENLAGIIGWLRLSPVLLSSLGVTGVYLLGQKLVGHKAALLATLLLAFDPFFTAHSRILNGDAVAAILMFLSVLSFLLYQQVEDKEQTRYIILSGLFAGLALLTKLPSPLVIIFIGLLGLVAIVKNPLPVIRNMIIWGGVVMLTFVIFWPAMWVAPIETLRLIYTDAFMVGGVGKGHSTFFFGQTVSDPGFWFYPYVIAFRLTPVVIVGVVVIIGWLFLQLKNISLPDKRNRLNITLTILAFIIFIVVFASLSPKKLDRYVMAVIPAIIFLAALGIEEIWRRYEKMTVPLFAIAITVQFIFISLSAPYYLTYYNPLMGGIQQATKQVPVGWGETLEQAAFYLNGLPDAESMAVSSWYGDIFHPYFIGQHASFSDDGRSQLSADYVVFYINQIQRQKPYPGLVDYFRAGKPVFTVNMTGDDNINWVEVYKAPSAQTANGSPKIEGIAQLLAYKLFQPPKSNLSITLFFRVLGELPKETTFGVTLLPNSLTYIAPPSIKGNWLAGNIVEWRVSLPPNITPGSYRLAVSFQFEDGTVIVKLPISEKDPLLRIK